MAKPVLFLGNGINRLRGGYNWQDTMQNLAKEAGITEPTHLFSKIPNTILFEVLYSSFLEKKDVHQEERHLKKFISKKLSNLPSNECHEKVHTLGIKHIITTNYDYSIEKSSASEYTKNSTYQESKYNLFRRNKVGNINIWHVHGEIDYPNTITLGFDHYAGNLEKMHSFLTTGLSPRYHKIELETITKNTGCMNKCFSWVDVFLLNDVHILGFGMDFSEIDIWWLTIYKQRMRKRNKSFGKTFYHSFIQEAENPEELEQTKIEVLKSLNVNVVDYTDRKGYTYTKVYEEVFRQIKSLTE